MRGFSVITLVASVFILSGVVHSAKTAAAEKPKYSDNVASASVVSSAKVLPPPQSKRSLAKNDEESIITAETQQFHYEQQTENSLQPQSHQQEEYLAFIQQAERNAHAQEIAAPARPQYHKLPTPERISESIYARNPGHPLAGSSLEKEIEKLVGSNTAQPYGLPSAVAHEQQHHHQAVLSGPSGPVSHAPTQHITEQHQPTVNNHQFRPPVVYKNQNDIVYIPYQEQAQARPSHAITKGKVQYISAYSRTPYPGEAINYGRAPQTTFVSAKPQESFKELYLQQQRENHLKRLQTQQLDNLNLQSHSHPQSINLLPKNQSPVPQPAHVVPEVASPAPNSDIAQLAERLFKTPLDQQKPLSQEQFAALVAAGYAVQAVHVPVVVPGPKASAPAPVVPVHRYSPAYPQSTYPVPHRPIKYHPNRQDPQPAPVTAQPHRFYPQGQQPQPQPQSSQYGGPYTYVLQQGENEENAAEKLRQQIIQEINSQTNKGVPSSNAGPAGHGSSSGFTPSRLEYQPSPVAHGSSGNQRHFVAAPAPEKTQEVDQNQQQYYKRLEYY